jgi:hypothetical protein
LGGSDTFIFGVIMGEYSFEAVWPSPSDAIRTEVVEFWLRESALPEGKAVERAAQLLVVCRDAGGAVAAVSTVVPSRAPTLGLRCFYFRALVGRTHRARGLRGSKLIYRLIRASYDALNERFQRGIDRDIVGLYLEVENPSVQRHRNELVWTDLGANIVFVGALPGGRHARVWYFDNAKIPLND